MVVAFVVVVVIGVVVTSSWFSRVGLEVTFEGFSGTQRFAFQAQPAPIKIPNPRALDPQRMPCIRLLIIAF